METKITSDENASISVTSVALLGPLFFTEIVIGAFTPVTAEAGAEGETAKSAGVALRSRTSPL
jgi:hypothetical protein